MMRTKLAQTLRGVVLVSTCAFGVAFLAQASCAPIPNPDRVTVVVEPDFATYAQYVDPYLARRCGTLDCHGQPGRAYRLYSREGLRLTDNDAGLVSGQQPTTPEEIQANFASAIGVEPEQMSRVVASTDIDPNTLLLLRKPLMLERHKGGTVMAQDDAAYKCVSGWLRVAVATPDGTLIPPAERTIPERLKDACTEAASLP